MPTRLCATLALLASLLAAPHLNAATREIPIKLVAGQPCARCIITGPTGSFPANIVIELGMTTPLVIHERTAGMLGLSAEQRTITLAFGDIIFKNMQPRAAGLSSLEELSRDYASELDEIPAVGYLGLGALEDALVEFDLAEGRLRLLDPQQTTLEQAEGDDGESLERAKTRRMFGAEVHLDYKTRDGALWLLGSGPDGFPVDVRLSTIQAYTYLDSEVALFFDAPAGDVDRLRIGRRLDVLEFVALRPEDLTGTGTPPAQVLTGTDLLLPFRMTIEPQRNQILLQQTRDAEHVETEREFYRVRHGGDPNALESWLKENTASRLANEAAGLLLSLRMRPQPANLEHVHTALRLRAATTPIERRSENLVAIADEFLGSGRDDARALANVALDLGDEWTEQDLNAKAVHEIQTRRGILALQDGDLKEARRQLLAAAFGMPRNPQVNLSMGVLYERMGKPVRAWSRYIQALLEDDALAEAKRGLDRLYHDEKFRRQFSATDAEELLEGRVASFHPPGRFQPDEMHTRDSGRLVEVFVSIDDGDTAAAELAGQGLAEFYEAVPLVVVAHHMGREMADPLASPISHVRGTLYDVADTPVAVFDGVMPITRGGDGDAAPAVFEDYQFAVDLFDWGRTTWQLRGDARLSGETLAVDLALDGPADAEHLRLFVLVCERGALVPGGNGVYIHENVARHTLTPTQGVPLGDDSTRQWSWQLTRSQLAEAYARNVETIEQAHQVSFYIRPTYAKLDEVRIVAFVQNMESKQVLAATQLNPQPAKETPTP